MNRFSQSSSSSSFNTPRLFSSFESQDATSDPVEDVHSLDEDFENAEVDMADLDVEDLSMEGDMEPIDVNDLEGQEAEGLSLDLSPEGVAAAATAAAATTVASSAVPSRSSELYIGNLSFEATEDQLQEVFESYGNVVEVRIPKFADSGRPRGFAFVRFESEDDAIKACELNGTSVFNRDLVVNISDPGRAKAGVGNVRKGPVSKDEVFIGNLDFDTTEEDLRELFSGYGEIAQVKIPRDPESGGGRGFGFVKFVSPDDAQASLEQDGSVFLARTINVNLSKKKERRGGQSQQRNLSERPEGCKEVFVGGLSFTVDEGALESTFEKCGDIVNARIVRDPHTGESRGFGYVSFASEDAIDGAITLSGLNLEGRSIRVDFATPRRNASFGGNNRKYGRGNNFGGNRGDFGHDYY